ncbi:MAG TPA: helix-turn-helix transcriptional regulator [Candidatus Nanoarchaeia archaeon]|nr:helix-turn-helix transcriptional regulator [Candidatus Nanoarchaeia archaeon]
MTTELPLYKHLRGLRKGRRISQTKIATQIRATQSAVSMYETGQQDALGESKIRAYAAIMHVDMAKFPVLSGKGALFEGIDFYLIRSETISYIGRKGSTATLDDACLVPTETVVRESFAQRNLTGYLRRVYGQYRRNNGLGPVPFPSGLEKKALKIPLY